MSNLLYAAFMAAAMALNWKLGVPLGPWELYLGGFFTGGLIGLWSGKHAGDYR